MGDKPVYISFDIDGIDPGLCPGTGNLLIAILEILIFIIIIIIGTPEIGGLTSIQALEIVRGCKGLNVIGGDLVEVNIIIYWL